MSIKTRMAQLAAGELKRSAAAEESLAVREMWAIRNDFCCVLAYDIPNGAPENYRHIDALIPYYFGEKWVKKILNTTWLIDTSLNAFQIRVDLRDDFPEGSKVVVTSVRLSEISHSGLDAESASWVSKRP